LVLTPRAERSGRMSYTVLRGGRVLDILAGTADPADILIE
jgi:hypothetical protein